MTPTDLSGGSAFIERHKTGATLSFENRIDLTKKRIDLLGSSIRRDCLEATNKSAVLERRVSRHGNCTVKCTP